MRQDEGELITRIRLLARLIEDELTEDYLAMPACLMKAEVMTFLVDSGCKNEAMLFLSFPDDETPLALVPEFKTFCQQVLDSVLQDDD